MARRDLTHNFKHLTKISKLYLKDLIMKDLCECNSVWQLTEKTYLLNPPDRVIPFNSKRCYVCGYDIWHDPLYENMMFDLKEMNK